MCVRGERRKCWAVGTLANWSSWMLHQALQVQHAGEPAGSVAGTVMIAGNSLALKILDTSHGLVHHHQEWLKKSRSYCPFFDSRFWLSRYPPRKSKNGTSPGISLATLGSRFRWPVYPSGRLCILHLPAQQRALAPGEPVFPMVN